MSVRIHVFMAARALFRSRTVTGLLVLAVAAGVAFQIPNAANVRGYEREIVEQGVTFGFGDVRVRPRVGQRFEDGDGLARRLGARPGTVGAVPILTLPGAVGSRRGELRGTTILGVDVDAAGSDTRVGARRVPFRLAAGHLVPRGDGQHLIVADGVSARIKATLGDRVDLRILFGPGHSLSEDLGRYSMVVVGIARASFVAPEGVIVDRQFLAGELGEPHAASVILVHIGDHFAAREEARRIAAEFRDVEAVAWSDDVPFLENALQGSAAVSAISQVMVIVAVMIPVWALLAVYSIHHRRDVGLLGALGFSRATVFAVFFIQALLIAAVGVSVGCAGGIALVGYFRAHPVFHAGAFVIRPILTWATLARPAVTVFLATVSAGAVPAVFAARLDPARVLRGAE